MYTVYMEHECACFKKSDYEKETSFNFQKDAYNYAHKVAEMMNEDFCSTHVFEAQLTTDSDFLIRVSTNPNAGSSCGTGSDDSSCSSGSCGC